MARVPSSGAPTNKLLSLVIVVILILSAYMVIQVSTLQSQVSSLQDQNSNLEEQIINLGGQQNYLQSQLNRLLTSTSTQTFSFLVQDLCVSVAPLCYTYPGHQGSYVYGMIIVNNGTVVIPVTSSVYLEIKDVSSSTYFGFNTSLPEQIPPGGGVQLNSTSWPVGTNATSKIAPGDELGVAVFVEDVGVHLDTHVISCGSSTTTFQNYTSTQTETVTSCAS